MVTTSNKLKDTLTSDLVTVTLLLLIDKPLHSLQWHIITTSAWVLAEVMFSLPFVCLLGEYWDHKNWLNFAYLWLQKYNSQYNINLIHLHTHTCFHQ